jgi:hypothetical protein
MARRAGDSGKFQRFTIPRLQTQWPSTQRPARNGAWAEFEKEKHTNGLPTGFAGRYTRIAHSRIAEHRSHWIKRRKKVWSGRLDLNQRPHAPQACALPGCATSRLSASHCACCSPRLQTRGSFVLAENPRLLRGELQHRIGPSAYHSDSRTVNNERSESRRSSNVLRLSGSECGEGFALGDASLPLEPFGSAAWSRRWRRAPAIVNPSS